jgi:hypothetical protein
VLEKNRADRREISGRCVLPFRKVDSLLQSNYPKPELLKLSEYLIPNRARLKLPSRFKKPFQLLFQFLHPTHLRGFRTFASARGPAQAQFDISHLIKQLLPKQPVDEAEQSHTGNQHTSRLHYRGVP